MIMEFTGLGKQAIGEDLQVVTSYMRRLNENVQENSIIAQNQFRNPN
jgi:hypothetical protein